MNPPPINVRRLPPTIGQLPPSHAACALSGTSNIPTTVSAETSMILFRKKIISLNSFWM